MRRVMLKLSGEALSGNGEESYSYKFVDSICKQIKKVYNSKVQLAIMTGGGNIIRGKMLSGIDQYKADEVGMLSTYMNCLYLQNVLKNNKIKSKIYGAFSMSDIASVFSKDDIINDMENGYVILLAGGTGHPYFTTDTGVVLRALELDCKEALLGKNIDGVYDKDPKTYNDAKKYENLTFKEMTDKQLKVIDLTASSLCLDTNLTLRIFLLNSPNSIIKAIKGENIGTLITN